MTQYGLAKWGAALLALWMAFSVNAAEYDFKLDREVGAIKVFKARDKERGYDRVRVQAVSEQPLEVLLQVNTDVSKWSSWMPRVLQADYVEPGTDRYTVRMRFSSPWPVKNRESITETRVTRNPETGAVRVAFHTVENQVPLSDDFVRIPFVDGSWEFTPLPNGQVGIVHEMLVNPGGNVPKWVVNAEAVDLPLNNVIKAMEQADKVRRTASAGPT